MATLYNVGMNTINYHIRKIFCYSEMQEDSVIRKFQGNADGGKKELLYKSLFVGNDLYSWIYI